MLLPRVLRDAVNEPEFYVEEGKLEEGKMRACGILAPP
jgi:hypothetical protein